MTPKQQLLLELENTPSPIIHSVLDFLRFLKAKQPTTDFMEFAGVAADTPQLMEDIVKDAETNRQLDLERNL